MQPSTRREGLSALRDVFLERIAQSQRGKISVKIKSLVSDFGFGASSRVSQSSLQQDLKQLEDWSIAYRLPASTSANDYITLSYPASPSDSGAPRISTKPALFLNPFLVLEPGTEYRVLSLHGPWAWAIIWGGKDVENRSWDTKYRGTILIHASSKRFVGDELREFRADLAGATGLGEQVPAQFPVSQLLGAVELVDCVQGANSIWADPYEKWHWIIRNPRPLEKPIKMKGKLNLWRWTA